MKNLVTLLLLLFFISSCKEDDTMTIFDGNQADLTGDWALTSAKLEDITLEIDGCKNKETISVDSYGNAIWKSCGLLSKSCDRKNQNFRFVALNSNFRIEYQSETITYHGKFLEPGKIEVISISKVNNRPDIKSVFIFTKKGTF